MTRKQKITEHPERKEGQVDAAGAAQAHSTEPIAAPLPPREVSLPSNAMPLLKADTREKRLYKIASMGTPLGSDFFDEFPDVQEILALSLSISTRLLIVAICNSELAPTQRIACMRLVAALNGKQLPSEESDPAARPAPPFSIPTGAADDVQRSLEKFRELSKAS